MSSNVLKRLRLTAVMTAISAALCMGSSNAWSQALDYHLDILAPTQVYAGHDLYAQVTPVYTSGSTAYASALGVSMNGVPVITQVWECSGHVECPKNTAGNYYWNSFSAALFRMAMPATLSPGSYTITITTESGGVVRSATLPVEVKAVPAPVSPAVSLVAPPIPGMAKWESTMLTLARKWCPAPGSTLSFGNEQEVWYYDGARTYFQIADYTQDRSWEACAFEIARQYRDYITPANGGAAGHRVFTHGLRIAYERTGDRSFRDAIVMLAKGSAWAQTGGILAADGIRETTYIAEAYMNAERVGEPRNPLLARAIDYLLGHYNLLFVSHQYGFHQTFMDGLAAEALIDYYELTRDPRIPAAIKQMSDWMWNTGWSQTLNQLVMFPDPPGPYCVEGCQQYMTVLINMVTPAMAWYWSLTGDAKYQQIGDVMFSHSLDNDISYSAKVFNQNFRWSNSFIKWRTGAGDKSCAVTVAPASISVAAAGGPVQLQVSAPAACRWGAEAGAWLSLSSGSTGAGSATITYTAANNASSHARSATVNVGGQPVVITQAGAVCAFTTPSAVSVGPAGGVAYVQVTAAPSDCTWSASSPVFWAAPMNSAASSGSGTAGFTVASNPTAAPVSAILTVANNPVTLMVQGAGTTAPSAGVSIWPATASPQVISGDPSAVELGVKFRSDVVGTVTGVRFYKGQGNAGPHTGSLWTSEGTLLATALFSAETPTGWQEVAFSTPVPISANTTYIVSYHTNNGHYAQDAGVFDNRGVDNGVLHALASTSVSGNGLYVYGPGGRVPNNAWSAVNYWVDVVFTAPGIVVPPIPPPVPPPAPPPTPAPTPAATIWPDGARPAMVAADPNAVELGMKFRSDTDGTITGIRFYKDAANNGVHTGSLWTATGNLLATGTFTNETATGWQTLAFGVPVAISANTTYVASYHTNSGHYGHDVGYFQSKGTDNGPLHALKAGVDGGTGLFTYGSGGQFPLYSWNASNYWVDVTFTASANNAVVMQTAVTACCKSILPNAAAPAMIAADPNPVELGMKFRSDVAGNVTGVRFYKGFGNTGVHTGSLWTSTGARLATGTFINESASGWQTVTFAAPVPIAANTTYIVSYHTTNGHYGIDYAYFINAVDNGPLHALKFGSDGPNGLYLYGSGGFPTNTFGAANYWVDVMFQ